MYVGVCSELPGIVSSDPFNIGVSALEAYSTQIDVSANNIANADTAGFQAQRVEFENLYAGAVAARIAATRGAGGLEPTGSATSLAISGAGFFVLDGPNGNPLYTRAGDFSTGVNGDLVDTASGFTVIGVGGGPIAIPSGVSGLAVGADGTVTGTLANGQATTLGRVALAVFQNAGGLLNAGGAYQASPDSGSAQLGAPATAGYGSLVPGYLESSNVDIASEIVKMIAAQAAYAANAKTIRTGDQMLKTIVNLDPEANSHAE